MEVSDPIHGENPKQKEFIIANSSCFQDLLVVDSDDNPPSDENHTPPKDFLCPITRHLFNDPVTIETGQTYERTAIQEWFDRGNSNCPITRQKLQNAQLPKTNYVLKRLIAAWEEQNSHVVKNEPLLYYLEAPSNPPNSVASEVTIDGTFNELQNAITKLCMLEIFNESEMATLEIELFWREANMEMKMEIQTMLSTLPVIKGFIEILFNSIDNRFIKATIFLLSELGFRDNSVIQTLKQVEFHMEGIVSLFSTGFIQALVLIYLLKPSTSTLVKMNLVDSLIAIIKTKNVDLFESFINIKTASMLLLGQISDDENSVSRTIVNAKLIEDIVGSVEARSAVESIAAVRILLRCMEEEGKCRNIIAEKTKVAFVLECFIEASDTDRFVIVQFLSELVKLNRRTFNEKILRNIKAEATYSIMHTLLIYLQTSLPEQCPVVAGLLLQLDLLAEPRKLSIYREEALDTLISCLRNSDSPASQIAAAETILSLQGRFTYSGKPLTRAFLLKRAGLVKNYKTMMRVESLDNAAREEEEKAAEKWERTIAFVLASHEFGLLFEVLADGLKSRYTELSNVCFVSATWLVHMLTVLPNTGIRGAACFCLLKPFISIFKSATHSEEQALCLLSLSSFSRDPEGMHELTRNMKDILKGLRVLKKSSPLAVEMVKVFSEESKTRADLWYHKELVQVDCSVNGKVLSVVCFKDKIFSGHSDGTIKVWTGKGSILHLIQETREHTKAVTSLTLFPPEEKLYSGSLDKTVRAWSVSNEVIQCIQVYDMKDQVHNLVVANNVSCFISHGAGVKVQTWNGNYNLLNPTKTVNCLALSQGRLYCGCHDNSIQDIDLATGTIGTIQSGSKKLLTKTCTIHALHVYDGFIYSASSPLDGSAVKIWNSSNHTMVGSLSSTLEVRAMAISSELIYLGCKGGIVEIWSREKKNKVETLQTGTNNTITCMALDDDEVFLVIGTSDGHLQAWELN